MSLRIEGLSRNAPARRVLDRVSLEVRPGELLALLGAPGSGRNALLRTVAGLEEPDAGRVVLAGWDITRLPPRRRPVAFLWRQDPLFGHSTVFEAVAAALPAPGEGAAETSRVPFVASPEAAGGGAGSAAQVRHLLDLVGLGDDGGWMPAMLPAGKRHRLALARALAAGPRVLLVGEAFGLADPTRQRPAPRRWLLDLHRRLGLTTILIAHGPAEALALADRIAVMNAGRVEQVGTPAELRLRPASGVVSQALGGAATPTAAFAPARAAPDARAAALLPPQRIEVVDAALGAPARVLGVTALGATMRLELQMLSDGSHVEAEVPSLGLATALPPGTIIGVRVRPPLGAPSVAAYDAAGLGLN